MQVTTTNSYNRKLEFKSKQNRLKKLSFLISRSYIFTRLFLFIFILI